MGIYKATLAKGAYDYGDVEYKDLVTKLTVRAVHVGKNLCGPTTFLTTMCDKWDDGNTLLLHVGENRYMHVGQEIYEFEMEDDFVAYYSILGTNDVPYPITLGSKYVYLMLKGNHSYIPRELFKAPMKPTDWADAYAFYYGHKDFETGEKTSCIDKFRMNLEKRKKCERQQYAKRKSRKSLKGTPMKGFKMIQKRM